MKKLLVIGLIVVGVGLGANPKVRRELGRAWQNAGTWFQCQGGGCDRAVPVPKDAEARKQAIERVRRNIAQLDNEIQARLDPVADLQLELNLLTAEIKTARANSEKRRKELAVLAQKVKAGTEFVDDQGDSCRLEVAKLRLTSAFADVKDLEANLKSNEELRVAKQQRLQLAREKLARIAKQKRALKLELARLETREERLQLQQTTTPLHADRGPVAQAKKELGAIRQSQDKEEIRRKLEAEFLPQPGGDSEPSQPAVNPDEVLNFLAVPGRSGATKVAAE